MISEERAEAAVEYLRDSAKEYGTLRGRMAYCESNLRRVKSLEMMGKAGSLGDREMNAYGSDAYGIAIQEEADSVAAYETMRALRALRGRLRLLSRCFAVKTRHASKG